MSNIRIGTWNITNNHFSILQNDMKVAAIQQLLKEQDLDILSLQEVSPIVASKIENKLKELNSEYQITTSYQKKCNPIANLRVEYNMIISRMSFYDNERVVLLPSKPTKITLGRLLSFPEYHLVSQEFEEKLYVNNTLFDRFDNDFSRMQFLETLYALGIQSELEYEPILTGCLNKKPTEKAMIEFMEELDNIDLKVANNCKKTYVGHKKEQPVDYIIIPSNWEVVSSQTLKNYDDISSHRPVVVEASKLKVK